MLFVLTGPNGAISFCVFTNWHLPRVHKELLQNYRNNPDHDTMFVPMGADISYHSYIPPYEGQDHNAK